MASISQELGCKRLKEELEVLIGGAHQHGLLSLTTWTSDPIMFSRVALWLQSLQTAAHVCSKSTVPIPIMFNILNIHTFHFTIIFYRNDDARLTLFMIKLIELDYNLKWQGCHLSNNMESQGIWQFIKDK